MGVLADHRGLHPVAEDFPRRPADRLQRRDMAAQHGLQVLVNDEASPDQVRIAPSRTAPGEHAHPIAIAPGR
jgi:hypothetical protein